MNTLKLCFVPGLILASLCIMFSCGKVERDFKVKLIIPSDYSGIIRIIFKADSEPSAIRNDLQIFSIPDSGVLLVGGINPFLKLGVIDVEDTLGFPIPQVSRMFAQDSHPSPNERFFRIVGGTNDGCEFWAVVGTEIDERSARMLLHNHESGHKQ